VRSSSGGGHYANRHSNRLIEITPDKSIIWKFLSPSLLNFLDGFDIDVFRDWQMALKK